MNYTWRVQGQGTSNKHIVMVRVEVRAQAADWVEGEPFGIHVEEISLGEPDPETFVHTIYVSPETALAWAKEAQGPKGCAQLEKLAAANLTAQLV